MPRILLLLLALSVLNGKLYSQQSSLEQSIDQKVESLLKSLSLEEKIGQMAQINITKILDDATLKHYDSVTVIQMDTVRFIQYIKDYHIGSFLNGRGITKSSWYKFMHQLHSLNQKYSKHKIPILYGVDHVHGSSYLKEGTIFPHNLNIASTFDTVFSKEMAEVTVLETSGLGHNWIFAPVLDIGRNKFWGRYYETYGEDPLVTTRMGKAFINGIQNYTPIHPYKVAACAKHFLGYSDPKSGWDRSPAEIPEQALREFFLPSFKAAIDAGVKTIMINSGELNGIPVHASYEILTRLLREELGFKGIAITDWMDIIALEKMHYITDNEKEATYIAIQAGIDMSMIATTTNFNRYVRELVQEGRITEKRIDESVRRILRVKFELGLFDHHLPDETRLQWIAKPESKQKALAAAKESIVLLKNDKNILPLKNPKKIVVTGATGNSKIALCGGWTYRFMTKSEWGYPEDMLTIFSAMKKEFPSAQVVYADRQQLPSEATNADLLIFAAGEKEAYAETDGSINTLDLSPDQQEWAEKVVSLQKPFVLVLTEGRPRMVADIYAKANAVLFAGLPGVEGAKAISEIISGKVNPSAKMSFTYPLRQGHVINYNYKKSEYSVIRPVLGELNKFALAEFGEGMSYTTFHYSDLTISDTLLHQGQKITATVTIKNTGSREGKEAILWFINDQHGSITRPVKELQHFEKINLKPGESRKVTFIIQPAEHLSYPDKNGKVIIEKGSFVLQVGKLEKKFWYQ